MLSLFSKEIMTESVMPRTCLLQSVDHVTVFHQQIQTQTQQMSVKRDLYNLHDGSACRLI